MSISSSYKPDQVIAATTSHLIKTKESRFQPPDILPEATCILEPHLAEINPLCDVKTIEHVYSTYSASFSLSKNKIEKENQIFAELAIQPLLFRI